MTHRKPDMLRCERRILLLKPRRKTRKPKPSTQRQQP